MKPIYENRMVVVVAMTKEEADLFAESLLEKAIKEIKKPTKEA